MQEILFRGKSKSEGRWVYEKVVNDDDLVGELNLYTGINDKNGKRIFEDDIVRFKHILDNFDCTVETIIGVIEFENGCFGIKSNKVFYNSWYKYRDIEVIGNKFDNPELLEE